MAGVVMKALGEERAEAVEALPGGGQFARGAAEALSGEVLAAVGGDDHEAAQFYNEIGEVGAGDCAPADPFGAVLEAFGRAGPAKDGEEPVGPARVPVSPSDGAGWRSSRRYHGESDGFVWCETRDLGYSGSDRLAANRPAGEPVAVERCVTCTSKV